MEANASTLRSWGIDQLSKLQEQQPHLIEQAIRRLLQDNEDIRWSLVVGAYRDGQINLGKAAEFLQVPELELRDRFIELGIPLRIGSADLAETHADAEAVRAWFGSSTDKDGS
jgi:predicted HTH domain antitoxin